MLCELKLPKLCVTTFRLSAAHKILEVRQLGKQPRSQPKLRWGGHLLGTKCHLCSASKCSSCRRPSFTMPVPREVLFSLWREYCSSSHVIFFFPCCISAFPQKWPSQVEVSFHLEEILQNPPLSCLAQGGKAWSLGFSSFSLLTDSQGKGQVSKWLSCKGRVIFTLRFPIARGPAGSLLHDTKSLCDLL